MLKDKLQADQLEAMKSGQKERLDTLRYILAQIKNAEIEKRSDLTDDDVLTIVKKQSKQLQESIDAFIKGGRSDLVTQYTSQKQIVDSYLPAELSDAALEEAVKKIIADNKEQYDKNPKTIIGICMKELKNQADPGRIMKVLASYGTA